MKLIFSMAIAIMVLSGISVSAQSKYDVAQVQKAKQKKELNFNCVVTVNGVVVLNGIATGHSAEEVENRLKKIYEAIFLDGNSFPIVKVTCTLLDN